MRNISVRFEGWFEKQLVDFFRRVQTIFLGPSKIKHIRSNNESHMAVHAYQINIKKWLILCVFVHHLFIFLNNWFLIRVRIFLFTFFSLVFAGVKIICWKSCKSFFNFLKVFFNFVWKFFLTLCRSFLLYSHRTSVVILCDYFPWVYIYVISLFYLLYSFELVFWTLLSSIILILLFEFCYSFCRLSKKLMGFMLY